MCRQIKASDFRNEVIKLARGKNHNTIFDYLRTAGLITNDRNGILSIDENCMDKVKFFTSEVQTGDITWNAMHGLLLIIDTRPAENNDGHHYRALKVKMTTDGEYQIIGEERSIVVNESETFRMKQSSFDIPAIDKLSYERYLAFTKIAKINAQLNDMKEKTHG